MLDLTLTSSEVERLLSGSQACKRASYDEKGEPHIDRDGAPGWTHERRAEVAVGMLAVTEDAAFMADHFDLWESLTRIAEERARPWEGYDVFRAPSPNQPAKTYSYEGGDAA